MKRLHFISTNLDQDGERFTPECIVNMLEAAQTPIPVYYDFNPNISVGKATNLTFDGENGYLDLIENEATNRLLNIDSPLYIVPGFYVLGRDENTITNAMFMSFGITRNPSDQTLKPINLTQPDSNSLYRELAIKYSYEASK